MLSGNNSCAKWNYSKTAIGNNDLPGNQTFSGTSVLSLGAPQPTQTWAFRD
jgi:hypothetical protein